MEKNGDGRRSGEDGKGNGVGGCRGAAERMVGLEPADLRVRRNRVARIPVGGILCAAAGARRVHGRGRLRRHADGVRGGVVERSRVENGGPTVGGYAEYDAVPGNCQAADTVERPRAGLSPYAGGHTDPHSALGMGSLVGFLAAKRAMQQHGIKGRLKFMGEPAEKVRGSKPIHAALGYYDDMDAAISFHPFYMLPLCNTVRWDTHCGAGYAPLYTFKCGDPSTWLASPGADGPGVTSRSRSITRRRGSPAPPTRWCRCTDLARR